jgi:hypothetical protein
MNWAVVGFRRCVWSRSVPAPHWREFDGAMTSDRLRPTALETALYEPDQRAVLPGRSVATSLRAQPEPHAAR